MGEAQKTWLGWDRNALNRCAAELVREGIACGGGLPVADLSGHVVVTPGGRASRLLLGAMVEECRVAGVALSPPLLVTPGEIGGVLIGGGEKDISEAASLFSWAAALGGLDAPDAGTLLRNPPAKDDWCAWMGFARQVKSAADELAGEGMRFADAVKRAGPALPESESPRWEVLVRAQAEYERVLAERGWRDARLRLLDADIRAEEIGKRIVLVGVAELSAAARRILLAPGVKARAFVHAPEALSMCFDVLGCLVHSAWHDRAVGLDRCELLEADDPAEAARATVRCVGAAAESGPGLSPADVVLCSPDAGLARLLVSVGADAGLEVRDASGVPMTAAEPWKLLAALAGFASGGSVAAMLELCALPRVMEWLGAAALRGRDGWERELDDACASGIAGQPGETAGEIGTLIAGAVRGLLGSLMDDAPRPIREHASKLQEVMERFYAGVELSSKSPSDRCVLAACGQVAGVLRELAAWEGPGAATGAAVAALAASLCRDEAVPLESTRRMVELLGWLELSLEPAQRVIVAGMNEGLVPAAAPADALLTDGVRRAMGLRSRSERYARDAYLLTALAESRRDDGKLTLLTLRSDTTGDPMRPSRLLFACDDQAAVQRLRNFLHGKGEAPRGGGAGRRQPGETLFPRMPLWPRPPIASMRVTAFSTYLRSPYLFYLSEVLGLREAAEPAHELDARAFGVLIHQSLEQFGNGPDAHLADEQRIRVSVHEALAATADKTLGRVRSAEVEMQLEVARARLAAFAQRQAAWRSEGWVIRKVEWKPDAAVAFDVDGRDFGLRGKIDRIDEHEKTGEFAVIDYKTGDTAADPEKTHGPVGDEGRWKDLQLPLYRRIAVGAVPGLTFGVGLKLAYFSLPRRADHTQVRIAPWTDAQLAAAEEVARSVVRAVREGKFAEEGPEPPLHGAFAAIMGTALLGGEVAP